MTKKKIYFVENLHGINYFLSVYDKEDSNLLVLSKDETLIKFIKEILPDEPAIIIPRIPIVWFPGQTDYTLQKDQLTGFREIYTPLFESIDPSTDAYFFGRGGTLHFFIILNYLKIRGVNVNYVDGHPEMEEAPIAISNLNAHQRDHLAEVSRIVGAQIIPLRCTLWIYLGLLDLPDPVPVELESWSHLAKKFPLKFRNEDTRAILIVDGPVQEFPGLDVEKTQKNIVPFFNTLILSGVAIHLKPHPNESVKNNSFTGTPLEKHIKILPGHFPAEMIMSQYPEVYAFNSLSLLNPIEGKKYSVGRLCVFETEDAHHSFWKIFNLSMNRNEKQTLLSNNSILIGEPDAVQDKSGTPPQEKKHNTYEAMVTILIPTMDRSEFLKRALKYYHRVNFKGHIAIGDSSNPEHTEKNRENILSYNGRLNIQYSYFPKEEYLNEGMVVQELIDLATTPYLVFSGDDDLLIPQSLARCAEFLESHPDYSAAHGLRQVLYLDRDGPHGKIIKSEYSQQHIWETGTGSDRWIGYMRNAASTQYHVHRKDTWKRMYREAKLIPMRYIGPELLPCGLSAISGKIKQLECLSVIFQVQDQRVFNWNDTSLFDLSMKAEWPRSIALFKESIVEAIVAADHIEKSRAQEIVEKELWNHIKLFFTWQYKKKYGTLPSEFCSRYNILLALKKNIFEIMTHTDWPVIVKKLRELSINALTKEHKFTAREAKPESDKEMWAHLLILMHKQFDQAFTLEPSPRNSEMESQYASAHVYNKLFSLESSLSPHSPFAADFKPVHEIICR